MCWPGIQHNQAGLNGRQDALQQHCIGPGKELPLLSQVLLQSMSCVSKHALHMSVAAMMAESLRQPERLLADAVHRDSSVFHHLARMAIMVKNLTKASAAAVTC